MVFEIVINLNKEIKGEFKFNFEKAISLFKEKRIRIYSSNLENQKVSFWSYSPFKYNSWHPFAYLDRIDLSAYSSPCKSILFINYKIHSIRMLLLSLVAFFMGMLFPGGIFMAFFLSFFMFFHLYKITKRRNSVFFKLIVKECIIRNL